MNIISKLLIYFLFFSYFTHANPEQPVFLSMHEGLLLLKLDIESDLAIMTVKKLKKDPKVYEIKLIPTSGKWMMKPLPRGHYQIVNIKVPYFNLPYIKSTEMKPGWQFTIASHKLNYVGEIKIQKERTEDFVNIQKYFRPAYHLPQIQQDLSQYLNEYPLFSGNSLRDDFLDTSIIEKGVNDE